ncbi:MAG: hypothetical protein KGP12_02245 [Actinomycetales bacterium]|nr:hypothetical protein [Actinomycetales bacterium]
MAVALSLIILACAVLLVLAFVTGRVSAMTRRTYLPPQPAQPADDASPLLDPPSPRTEETKDGAAADERDLNE